MSLRIISQRFLRSHLLIPVELQCCCQRKYSVKLYPMGKFQEPNEKADSYMPGQMFFHKVFAYRGVVLQSWQARVYDNDEKDRTGRTIRSKRKTQLYYQVLVDKTDSQFIRAENLSMSFLPLEYGNITNNRNTIQAQPNSIPGVDYVSHQDMMPYQVTSDAKPIKHELFDKFFTEIPDSDTTKRYEEKDTLKSFQESNHPWLSLSDVFKETTENIRVTVIPFYIGKQEIFSKYWWRYCIRIENLGEETVQLRDRNWKIFCNNNSVETLQGRGVIGKEPRLSKDSPAFQYNSHVSLDYPSGYMWGLFTFEREDGSKIECKIPPFNLQRGDVKLHDPSDDIIG
ncbi:polymerase delta-interacting protein 2-like isoform X2 [Ruditapes philippinarum]|uniref:polymerase delta-interacting protein 2-like isoform X2 n=1 Tax=Ruditapes philippinarum TaxID=129788 RepID=UPI00295A81D0|nr:polymerase delta-interacting protein 2-like isoform X2 [Ruditapes philippinarum]